MKVVSGKLHHAAVLAGKQTRYQKALDGGYRRGKNAPGNKLTLNRYDAWLKSHGKLHLMTVDRRSVINVAGAAIYTITCQCGRYGRLTAEEIYNLDGASLGCGAALCTAPDLPLRLTYNPVEVIALQLVQLDSVDPSLLSDTYRGGNVYSTAENIYQHLRDGRQSQDSGDYWGVGCLWFTNVFEVGINDLDDLELGRSPDGRLFPKGNAMVRMDGELMTVAQLADAFNLEPETVLEIRLKFFDNDVIDKVIGEYDERRNE